MRVSLRAAPLWLGVRTTQVSPTQCLDRLPFAARVTDAELRGHLFKGALGFGEGRPVTRHSKTRTPFVPPTTPTSSYDEASGGDGDS
jgi:hypothetical protein